ncbi:MAG: DUF3943 domain-containing protein [Candidatus Saccharicenans sp.]
MMKPVFKKAAGWLLLIAYTCLPAFASPEDKKNDHRVAEKFLNDFSLSLASFKRMNSLLEPGGQDETPVFFSLSRNNHGDSISPLLPVTEFNRLKGIRPRWGRAGLELAVLMSYSQARYWIRYSRFIEDWQFRLTWADQRRRFFTTEALRFDSNAFYLNWTHAFAGMLYYEFARTNNLSLWQSSIFSIGGSLYWEYIVEWREIISINDNIMTAIGGISLGEAWYQLGRYLYNSPNAVGRFLSWLNPYLKFNDWLDRKKPLSAFHHNYNLSAQDVYLFLGYRRSPVSANPTVNTGNLAFSLHSRLYTDAGYGLPGRIDEKFTEPLYSQLDFDFMYHGKNREEIGATAKIVPLGRIKQNISSDGHGYSLYYGLGSSFFLYVKRPITDYDAGKIPVNKPDDFRFELPRDFRDKLAAVHLVGPVIEAAWYSGPFKLRLKAEAYPSFGMINSLPLNGYSADNDIRSMKSTLKFYGYYYAFGPDFESLAEIQYGRLRFQAFSNYVYYRSIQGLDRFQNETGDENILPVTDDSVLFDSRWHYGTSIEYRLPGTFFSITASLEAVRRWGRIHDFEERSLEKRLYLGVKYRL